MGSFKISKGSESKKDEKPSKYLRGSFKKIGEMIVNDGNK